jgi:hypothetical protein
VVVYYTTTLTLSLGGLSFYSARKGFVCDSVRNFEIVLAGGQIVNANAKENPDLWIALRGGSNNFGVVTRFDIETFEQGDFWGGSIRFNISLAPKLLEEFHRFDASVNYDDYASLIQVFAFARGGYFPLTTMDYTKPVSNPPVFQPFTALEPQYTNSMRISNLSDFTSEAAKLSPNGRRFVIHPSHLLAAFGT